MSSTDERRTRCSFVLLVAWCLPVMLAGCPGPAARQLKLAIQRQQLPDEYAALAVKIHELQNEKQQRLAVFKFQGKEPTAEQIAALGPTAQQLARMKELREMLFAKPERATRKNQSQKTLDIFRGQETGRIAGRILDYQTRKPIHARVRIVDRLGNVVESRAGDLGFWAPGQFTVRVLSGLVQLEISRGPGTIPFKKSLYVKPGRTLRLRPVLLTTSPGWRALRAAGWRAADLHAVVDRRPPPYSWADPSRLLNAALGEGLDIVALSRFHYRDLPADLRRAESPVLAALDLATHGPRGRLYALAANLDARPASMPTADLSLGERAQIERAAGRLIVCRHPTSAREADPRTEVLPLAPHLSKFYQGANLALVGLAAELPLMLLAGEAIDALDLDLALPSERKLWFSLLNRGYRLPAIYSAPEPHGRLDLPRATTFVRLADGDETPAAVLAAIRAGRVLVSQGPLVILRLRQGEQEVGPGDSLPTGDRPFQIVVEAYAEAASGASIQQVELIRNGEVVLTRKGAPGQTVLSFRAEHVVEKSACWYLARVVQRFDRGEERTREAWTNPVFVGRRRRPPLLRTTVRGRVIRPGGARSSPRGAHGLIEARIAGVVTATTSISDDGSYEITCSPYARLVARIDGYAPQQRRVYPATQSDQVVRRLHCDLDGEGPESLFHDKIYELTRLHASQARLDFPLATIVDSKPERPPGKNHRPNP